MLIILSVQAWINKYLWIVILVVALLIIFGVALGLFLMARRRSRHQIKDLRKKYSMIHELLTGDCKNMLMRIDFISQRNPRYTGIHDQYQISYNNILSTFDISCDQAIGSLESLIKDKQYRGIKEIIESTKINIHDFNRSVHKLNDDLSAVLKPDEECRSNALSVKEQFRLLKEDYTRHATELRGLETSFEPIFLELDNQLESYEDLLDSAEYTKAQEKLKDTTEVIIALEEAMKKLPLFNTLVRVVLPKRIESVTTTYDDMVQNNFPLHHLHFKVTIEKIQAQLQDLEERLAEFRLGHIQEEVDQITDTIENFFASFESEREAKRKFENEQSHTSDDTYELEKEFARLKRSLPEYKNIYVIDDSYIEQINLIQEDITRMSSIKRDLDTFIHSSTKQPYSILLKKMLDLQVEMNKITKTLEDFHSYLISLKNDSERVYDSIRTNYRLLKEAEYTLRVINVQALQDSLHLSFESAYTYLSQENDVLSQTPIDVVALNNFYSQSELIITSLLEVIKNQSELAVRAENSIVYANILREQYSEARRTLEVAERSFNEADFTRAANEALGAIKKLRPDLNS